MFAKNMKKIMKEKGITGAELAKKTGFSKAAISQYLNNINTPSPERVEAIAETLGVTVEELNAVADDSPEIPNPQSIQPVTTITVKRAAKLLHKKQEYIQQGLQEGRPGFEFGSAVKTSTKWSYCIYAKKFTEITGIPV